MAIDQSKPAIKPDQNPEDIHRSISSHYSTLAFQIGRSGNLQNEPIRLRVSSSSMSPLLQPGDFIDLEVAQPESLKRGDMVTFQNNGDLLTHRLVYAGPQSCLTKGDAALGFDPPIDRSRLLGRVVAFERDGNLTIMRGWRWNIINRIAGWLSFWEGWAVRLAGSIFHRDREAPLPRTLPFLARLVSGLLRLPVKILLKLFAL